MTDELPGSLLREHIQETSRSISGGALRIAALVQFEASMDIPKHARQFGDDLEEDRASLLGIVRQRFYGDVRRDAVAAFHGLVKLLDPLEAITDELREKIAALFDPLLNAGRAIEATPEPTTAV